MVAVWNKLVRHNLYSDNDIKFIPGIDMGEDELVSHKLFYYADKVVYLPLAFVHYVCYNPNSYSPTGPSPDFQNNIPSVIRVLRQ